MEPLKPPKTIKIYQLLRQTGMTLSFCAGGTSGLGGSGFYLTREEAEHNRTLEVLKDTSASNAMKPQFHVFELELPNPAYTE